MTTSIVGVHGIWNYGPGVPSARASALSTRWGEALEAGFARPPALDVQVAYYAHLLRPATRQGPAHLADLDPRIRELILAWADLFDPPREVAQGRGTEPARRALEWVATRFGLDHGFVRTLITRFLGEVEAYLYDPDATARTLARDLVAEQIRARRPRVVIAHSLGSVVAYEALWRTPDVPVDLFLTLGSPLAMPDVIFNRLDPAPHDGRGARPPGVRSWVSIADPGDIVAVPRPLSDYFTGIDADLNPSIHLVDFHLAGSYLANPTTAAAITPYLTPPEN